MQAICNRYMGQIALPEGGRVLEVGCGNGAATKLIMHISIRRSLWELTRRLCLSIWRARLLRANRGPFLVGDAVAIGQADACFDLVIAHTVYSHLPDPEGALIETRRVLRPGGQLVIFDGDYATITVALFDGDPLQAPSARCCVISCTLPTSCGDCLLSWPQRGSVCSLSSHTATYKPRLPIIYSRCCRAVPALPPEPVRLVRSWLTPSTRRHVACCERHILRSYSVPEPHRSQNRRVTLPRRSASPFRRRCSPAPTR